MVFEKTLKKAPKMHKNVPMYKIKLQISVYLNVKHISFDLTFPFRAEQNKNTNVRNPLLYIYIAEHRHCRTR